jgi:hypothetical protein
MSQTLKIGYIGLGIMGKSIARNILKAGFPMVVHNRSQSSLAELVGEGAEQASSPAEVAARVDVVFTSLPDSPDVELVALGENGIIFGAHPGLIYVDNSTIKPATARHIAAVLEGISVPARVPWPSWLVAQRLRLKLCARYSLQWGKPSPTSVKLARVRSPKQLIRSW